MMTVKVFSEQGKELLDSFESASVEQIPQDLDSRASLREYCLRNPRAGFNVRFEDADGHGGWMIVSDRK